MVTVIQSKEQEKTVVFSFKMEKDCHAVLTGTFNGWNREQYRMRKTDGGDGYTCTLHLPAGIYEYCFILDGCRFMDKDNGKFAANEFGTVNSIVEID